MASRAPAWRPTRPPVADSGGSGRNGVLSSVHLSRAPEKKRSRGKYLVLLVNWGHGRHRQRITQTRHERAWIIIVMTVITGFSSHFIPLSITILPLSRSVISNFDISLFYMKRVIRKFKRLLRFCAAKDLPPCYFIVRFRSRCVWVVTIFLLLQLSHLFLLN